MIKQFKKLPIIQITQSFIVISQQHAGPHSIRQSHTDYLYA